MKQISNIKWRFEYKSSTEPLLMMKQLFSPSMMSKLIIAVNTQQARSTSTSDFFRFWFASNLTSIKNSQLLHSQHIKSTVARSLCLELIQLEHTKLDQEFIQNLSHKLKEQGWIRFKLRKQEFLSPLFSWQQYLNLDLVQSSRSTNLQMNLAVESCLTDLEIMCRFMGTHADCEMALNRAIKIAQSKLSEAATVFQLKTLSADTEILATSKLSKIQVFSFVFSKVDYYFLDHLKTQRNFSIELIYPSIHGHDAGMIKWSQKHPDLGQCIWTNASFNIYISNQASALKESVDTIASQSSFKSHHEDEAWLALNQKHPLRWTQESSTHTSRTWTRNTARKSRLSLLLNELDAMLITDTLVEELREYLLGLSPNDRKVYSLALLEIDQSSYYLVRLTHRAKVKDEEAQHYGVSKYWTVEHVKMFKAFIQELQEIESDRSITLGDPNAVDQKVLFFRQVARQPLLYLSLDAELKPKLDDQGLLRRIYAHALDPMERLYLLSPQLDHKVRRTQIKAEHFEPSAIFTELAKPTFYHAEDFPLILQPKRLANIKQWFDEAFLSLTPEAFDE